MTAIALAIAYCATLAYVWAVLRLRVARRSADLVALDHRVSMLEAALASGDDARLTDLATRVKEIEPQVEMLAVASGLKRRSA